MAQNVPSKPIQSPAPATPQAFLVTGTYQGLKAPMVNGIVTLANGLVNSYVPGSSQPTGSSTPTLSNPAGLCGDMTNGIAVFSGTRVAYLNGVGVPAASWYSLPSLPSVPGANGGSGSPSTQPGSSSPAAASIKAMCGDLVNGLVITDGTNLYSMLFNGGPQEWTLMTAPPPGPILGIAGDPTNGMLLVIGSATGGPSSLFFASGGCSCAWVPLTSGGSSLPVARIRVSLVCGTAGNGFVIYGENQFYSYMVKFTAATASAPAVAAATPNRLPSPPFAITALVGDTVNGCTAIAADSGLIANAPATLAAWTVINAAKPASAATPAPQPNAAPAAAPPAHTTTALGHEPAESLAQAA